MAPDPVFVPSTGPLSCELLPLAPEDEQEAQRAATADTPAAEPTAKTPGLHFSSELGVVGVHPELAFDALRVAPTTGDDLNTLSLDLLPVACLSIADNVFEFDSSFVRPHAAPLLRQLPVRRALHANATGGLPPLAIFGHADPVGTEDYNKELSGRRARAVFGLLTHQPSIWQELQNQPFGGDNWNTKGVVGAMRRQVGASPAVPVRDLILLYMRSLFPAPLTKDDFIGRGQGPNGKADVQGCGEFNPLVILSAEENRTLPVARRNTENVPNRRVLVFLFPPGSRVQPALWPCPTAREPAAGCRRRFFADAKERLAAGPKRKERRNISDPTFGCRFYARMAQASPCERIPNVFRIRLFDPVGTPLKFAPFRVDAGGQTIVDRVKDDAFLTLTDTATPSTALVRWSRPTSTDGPDSPPPAPDAEFDFTLEVRLDIEDDGPVGARLRLENLGYSVGPEESDDVSAFQRDHAARFGLAATGQLDPATMDAIKQVHDGCDPERKQPRPQGAQ